jgi:hypothetical protein
MTMLRFEGFDYTIDGEVRPGVTRFVRPKDSEAPVREGLCATADITDSGEGWSYLPCRIGPALGGDPEIGIAPHPLRELIRDHPAYRQGRDDLARQAVAEAVGF